ncbi:unnamed protein product [Ceutorhynchus assimilis]|uniref:TGF-beta propeptide domain-containing protein n=1 Tax=Ceutorhynchus assimilis TaxID=467358 RepID=A0A9P0DHY5_9CUCU|nr:unnamed protein product [Ceutorhynchus assimilis]
MFSSILTAYLVVSLYLLTQINAAPSTNLKNMLHSKQEFEKALDNFLNDYYEEILEQSRSKKSKQSDDDEAVEKKSEDSVDVYDQMQGDQAVSDESVVLNYNGSNRNMSDDVIKTRDRYKREVDGRLRKENWKEYLKSHILGQLRVNSSNTFTKPPEDPTMTDFNITQIIPQLFNSTTLDDDLITEKIRSFYPSCDPPPNQEQDQWKDSEDIMNLFFDFDYTDNRNSNIATATLRLYRLPQNSSAKMETVDDCKPSDSIEEEKLLRVSVYWYTKFQKKRRVKRRLSDSKVVPETSRWVELSVKPATKAWNKIGTRNLGLGILVEDQEGKALRADKYFKGASCTVGVSTPKPIPTIVRDTSTIQADELDRIHSLFGRNSTSTVYSDVLLLPTIDICYLEFPENTDITHFDSARINACNLRKIHEENQRLAERERVERLATWHFASSPRHIRHQRQHRQSKMNDLKVEDLNIDNGRQMSELERNLRSSISNKQIVFTREELEEFQRNRGLKR